MQDIVMRTLNDCRQQFIEPWGLNTGIVGETWNARTILGNAVSVWVPSEANSLPHSYFCHGWALGTYQIHGYTVYSGTPLTTVLADEWHQVMAPAVGDICVWYGPGAGHLLTPLHSARVDIVGGGGAPMQLSSKNGAGPLGGLQTMAAVNAIYAAAPHNCAQHRFYRRNVPLPIVLPLLPQ